MKTTNTLSNSFPQKQGLLIASEEMQRIIGPPDMHPLTHQTLVTYVSRHFKRNAVELLQRK